MLTEVDFHDHQNRSPRITVEESVTLLELFLSTVVTLHVSPAARIAPVISCFFFALPALWLLCRASIGNHAPYRQPALRQSARDVR